MGCSVWPNEDYEEEVKMVNIKEIVGEQNFARLKKAKISSPARLNQMTEEEVMAIAGIGPETAYKLFTALGRRSPKKNIRKKYNALKKRTKYKRIKRLWSAVSDKPEEKIKKLEGVREILHGAKDVISALGDFGKPPGERKHMGPTYQPVSLTISPFDSEMMSKRYSFFSEIKISKEGNRYKSEEIIKNNRDFNQEGTRVDYVQSNIMDLKTLDTIGKLITARYGSFKSRTPGGILTIIVPSDSLSLHQFLENKFNLEINQGSILLVKGMQEYYDWEGIIKYDTNAQFKLILHDLQKNYIYFVYHKYIKENPNVTFKQFLEKKESKVNFWETIESTKESTIKLDIPEHILYFGLVEGKNYGYQRKGFIKTHLGPFLELYKFNNYEEFKEIIQQDNLTNIAGVNIPTEILSLIENTLGESEVWTDKNKVLIFVSTKLPEVGFIFRRVENGK